MEITQEKKAAFAKDLEELQKKHGMVLSTTFILQPIQEEAKTEEAK